MSNDTNQNNDKLAYAIAIQARIPTILWGPPGTAKTSYTYSIAKALKRQIRTVMLSSKEPQDIAGLPIIDVEKKQVTFAPPDWALGLQEDPILLFDELSTAPPAVQAPALRIFYGNTVGDFHRLPKGTSLAACANPVDQAAGGWELAPPLANRLFHINWDFSPQDWAKGFIAGWPTPVIPVLPKNWNDHVFNAKTLIASFINKSPSFCLDYPKNEAQTGRAWPSPRSWEMAAVLLGAGISVGASTELQTTLISGCVGEGAALAFVAWKKELNLPDPEELIKNPDSLKLEKRSDINYTILASVISAVAHKPSKQRWEAGCRVIAKAAKTIKDVAAQALRAIAEIRPEGAIPPDEIKEMLKLLSVAE